MDKRVAMFTRIVGLLFAAIGAFCMTDQLTFKTSVGILLLFWSNNMISSLSSSSESGCKAP